MAVRHLDADYPGRERSGEPASLRPRLPPGRLLERPPATSAGEEQGPVARRSACASPPGRRPAGRRRPPRTPRCSAVRSRSCRATSSRCRSPSLWSAPWYSPAQPASSIEQVGDRQEVAREVEHRDGCTTVGAARRRCIQTSTIRTSGRDQHPSPAARRRRGRSRHRSRRCASATYVRNPAAVTSRAAMAISMSTIAWRMTAVTADLVEEGPLGRRRPDAVDQLALTRRQLLAADGDPAGRAEQAVTDHDRHRQQLVCRCRCRRRTSRLSTAGSAQPVTAPCVRIRLPCSRMRCSTDVSSTSAGTYIPDDVCRQCGPLACERVGPTTPSTSTRTGLTRSVARGVRRRPSVLVHRTSRPPARRRTPSASRRSLWTSRAGSRPVDVLVATLRPGDSPHQMRLRRCQRDDPFDGDYPLRGRQAGPTAG